jgi:formyltetrahydrofolate synthetase
VKSSLEIAQAHQLIPIEEIAERSGLLPAEVEPYGRYKAKIALSVLERLKGAPDAKLVCVAGMTPTRAGEGNTTTLISLTDGLAGIGKHPVACLREPSLGPALGVKGGAAGGGRAQALPMEDPNLHFTGDTHAIGAANNLLAAMIDASILHGNPHRIDALQVLWRRAVDMNDRALRKITVGLKGRANGYPRQTGFDITAASEVMAIMAVARDLPDLRRRLGRITPAYSYEGGRHVTAEDLGAAGAMTVLLKDALKPNLVQTLEGQSVMVHCGPLGNIDHGNNSLIADLVAMKLGDYVLTESGFGSDMGMEKFFNIVCRFGRLTPSAVVLVITLRAIKHQGGLSETAAVGRRASLHAIANGMANVRQHLAIIAAFGVPAVVAINQPASTAPRTCSCIPRPSTRSLSSRPIGSDGFLSASPRPTSLCPPSHRC